MLVQPISIPEREWRAFEQAIVASGREPRAFKAQMFTASSQGASGVMRRVHVVTARAAAQYDASVGDEWTLNFARHLARGFFG